MFCKGLWRVKLDSCPHNSADSLSHLADAFPIGCCYTVPRSTKFILKFKLMVWPCYVSYLHNIQHKTQTMTPSLVFFIV